MAEIISVRFRSEGKQYYFDPQGMVCRPGDGLIVETASGLEYAQCVRGNFTLAEAELAAPLRPVWASWSPAPIARSAICAGAVAALAPISPRATLRPAIPIVPSCGRSTVCFLRQC